MSEAPRVVFDASVVLSALVFRQGRLAPLRVVWQRERCRALVSRVTVAELMRALAYPKFHLSVEEQRELVADYLPHCLVVRMPARAVRIPRCRDPFDVPFLELAVVGQADFLVTGDRDLLAVSGELACSIVTPSAFLEALP